MNTLQRGLGILGAALSLLLIAIAGNAAEPPRDAVLIHVRHGPEDPHCVLMALAMAYRMAADHDMILHFDIKGVEVLLAEAPDLHHAQSPDAKEQLASLLAQKVTIMACPSCLQVAGKAPADLAPGIAVADKAKFFSFTQGRILTLDY